MRALITGIAGFAGSHLADFLLGLKDVEVLGIDIPGCKISNIEHIKNRIRLYECNLCDAERVTKIIKAVRPERIFHLAAQSTVSASWAFPTPSLVNNISAELNLFEAVRKLGLNSRIQIACSAEEYGRVLKDEIPLKEDNLLRPLSPYAVGKVTQDLLGYQYHQSYGMFIVRTRAFNHCGPRMSESFVASSFARQIALIEKGRQGPVIYVGNLEAVRDFTDVRDMVRAYWLCLSKCKAGEAYNICSGRGHKIKRVLELLLGFTQERIKVKKDKSRLRPSDALAFIGDNTKFCRQTGWSPGIPLKQTLKDILDYWRRMD
jgi:GDP-4-dehydro-6-deoxy-D-mannose reductase